MWNKGWLSRDGHGVVSNSAESIAVGAGDGERMGDLVIIRSEEELRGSCILTRETEKKEVTGWL